MAGLLLLGGPLAIGFVARVPSTIVPSAARAGVPQLASASVDMIAPASYVGAADVDEVTGIVKPVMKGSRSPESWYDSGLRLAAPELEFDDFERECFGDQDGCDMWFYGGAPQWDEVNNTPENLARKAALMEDGKEHAFARQQKAKAMEAVMQRLKAKKM